MTKSTSPRTGFRLATASLTLGLALLGSASAAAVVFSNTSSIGIPGSGPATLYPSQIIVTGITGPLLDVNVSLFGLSHRFASDVDMLLVGPGGQNVLLMSDYGGASVISNVDLTFDQDASQKLPLSSQISSGTFQPSNIFFETFPDPAPGGLHGETLDVFDGLDPNGTWSLYIVDDASGDAGELAGGWSIEFTTAATDVPEPASLALFALGLAGLAFARRRRHAR